MNRITRIVTKAGEITADDRKIVVRLKWNDLTPGVLYPKDIQANMQTILGAATMANTIVRVEMVQA